MHVAFQILRWPLGGLLYLAAILLYENEEQVVQNRLEDLWLWAAYTKDAELSRAARFLQGVARLSNRAFDGLLGKRLWSFQAVGVSLWFSLASAFAAPFAVAFITSHIPKIASHARPVALPFHLWIYAAVCILLGLLPSLVDPIFAFVAWTAVGGSFLLSMAGFIAFAMDRYGFVPVLRVLTMIFMLVLFSFGFDVLYISGTRWMLRIVFEMRRFYEILLVIALDVLLAFALVYGPIELTLLLTKSYLLGTSGAWLVSLVMFNFGDFIACSVFFIVMLAVLLHRLMWPILERHIYALQRFGLIRRKWLLLTIASLLWFGPKGIGFVKFAMQFFH